MEDLDIEFIISVRTLNSINISPSRYINGSIAMVIYFYIFRNKNGKKHELTKLSVFIRVE
jgi:hypothetical protein